MGLAASQARYLSLVARQSNLEYQGQQINQERSVLAQQVADLYNTLLGIDVPTPPRTNEYTTVTYKATHGADNFTIGTVKPDNDNLYIVELKIQTTGPALAEEYNLYKAELNGADWYVGSSKCMSWSEFSDPTLNPDYNQQYEDAVKNTFGDDFDFTQLYVFSTLTNGVTQYHFALKNDVTSDDGFTKAYTYQTGTYTKSEETKGCKLEFGQDGRITRIGLPDNPTSPTQWNFVDVVATETTDTNAYNDAMAEYEYQQFLYDKKQTELDAKTEEIQQQDRNLELKLQRLDSERKQITAEIDALKEVIKTNIDNSFKTFSG